MATKIAIVRLPDCCITHGSRNAAARRLAEAGCSANEIAAITEHSKLIEVSRYPRTTEQKKLAQSTIDRLHKSQQPLLFQNPLEQVGGNQKKLNKIITGKQIWRTRQDKCANTYLIEFAT